MTTLTWVSGSTKNWSDSTAWSPNQTPTAADDLVFGAASTGTLTVDGTSGSPNLCRSIDFTGFTGTLTHATTKQINVGTSTAGAFKLVSGMTYAPSATSLIKFVSTTTGNNITTAGKAVGSWTFDGVGGVWQFQDAVNPTASCVVTLTNGSLDTNGQTIGNTNGVAFSSSNSNTRSLTLGASNWKLGANSATKDWDITTSTGMTLSAGSSTIQSIAVTASPNFNGGGLTYGTLTCTTLTTGTFTITGANTFATMTASIAGTAKSTTSGYVFPSGSTTTVTGTFTSAGNTLLLRNFLYSSTIGTAATISAGTFTITNTDLRDITKAGSGSGDISATSSSTGNGDCGGNSGWTFQASRNVYMKTAVSVNWSAANWFTTSGGSTAAVPPLPLCHDTNAIFDANSVTAGSKVITIDQPRISGFTFNGVANNPALANTTLPEVYGSVVFGTNTITSFTPTLSGRGAYSLNQNGVTWDTSGNPLIIAAPTGTYTLAANFSGASDPFTMQAGTLALGGFNFTTGAITVSGGTISGTGAITGTTYTQSAGTVTLGGTMTLTGAIALSGGTLSNNSNQITGHTTFTNSGGTVNLSGQINGSGAISLTSGTTNDSGASGEYKGTTFSCSGGTHTIRKTTCSSTWAQSSSSSITIPAGGSATWATSWTWTGITYTFITQGSPTWSSGALSLATVGAIKMAGDGGGFVG